MVVSLLYRQRASPTGGGGNASGLGLGATSRNFFTLPPLWSHSNLKKFFITEFTPGHASHLKLFMMTSANSG